MSRVHPIAPILAAAVLVAGCEEKSYDPPDDARRIELADSLYSPALFDTIHWASADERAYTGNLVYADHCRRCHGSVGEGGSVVAAGNHLEVPSLLDADWWLQADAEAVRRRIFTGHPGGMPSWGISRLTPREIDAAAFYIMERLRPEMLESPAPPVTP